MYTGRTLAATVCGLMLAAGPAYTQAAPGGGQTTGGQPGGQTGGLFGRQGPRDTTRSRQTLAILVNGSTGVDRNRDSNGQPLPPATFGAQQSGTISSVDGALAYSANWGRSSPGCCSRSCSRAHRRASISTSETTAPGAGSIAIGTSWPTSSGTWAWAACPRFP